MEEENMNFLKEFGQDYGYPNSPKNIEQIRASEFKRLEGLVYLDHAGATLYSELQMESILKDFTSNVYGNPHSQSDVGSATSNVIRSTLQKGGITLSTALFGATFLFFMRELVSDLDSRFDSFGAGFRPCLFFPHWPLQLALFFLGSMNWPN